jgi:hypothetical protein
MTDHYSPETVARFWAKVDRRHPDDCWLWKGAKTTNGYGVFHHPKNQGAHRYSAELAFGPGPDGAHVCHRCDNPACVNPKHLFYGSRSDNMRDARRKGRMRIPDVHSNPEWRAKMLAAIPKGENVATSKLTDADVIRIRKLRVSGASLGELAKEYAMDKSTISDILNGIRWKHVFDLPGCPTLGELLAVPVNTRSSAKITPDIAKDIKRRLAKGETGRSIAKLYGLHFASISDIRTGKTWRDV